MYGVEWCCMVLYVLYAWVCCCVLYILLNTVVAVSVIIVAVAAVTNVVCMLYVC